MVYISTLRIDPTLTWPILQYVYIGEIFPSENISKCLHWRNMSWGIKFRSWLLKVLSVFESLFWFKQRSNALYDTHSSLRNDPFKSYDFVLHFHKNPTPKILLMLPCKSLEYFKSLNVDLFSTKSLLHQ